jgi:esterase/lipase
MFLFLLMISRFLILLMISSAMGLRHPTILLHGIGGTSSQLKELEGYLISQDIEVYNIEIGNGKIDSITMNMNKQCKVFADEISALNIHKHDFINIIGISQGGLTARCYVERYSHLVKPVYTLITMGTPHMGYFNSKGSNILGLQYWKDPFRLEEYLKNNDYLAPLNNENIELINGTYIKAIQSLHVFLVIWSNIDNVIIPRESSRFEYYKPNTLLIEPLEESRFFTEDFIGIRHLSEQGKLWIEQFDCNHEDFKHKSCFLDNEKNKNNISIADYIVDLVGG